MSKNFITKEIPKYVCEICGGDHPTETHSQEDTVRKSWTKRYEDGAYREGKPHPQFPELYNKYENKIPAGGKVLDNACGNGRNLLEMARRGKIKGYKVFGLELTQIGIQQARDKLRREDLEAEITQGSFLNLPYEDGSFDEIIAWASFQHNDWPSTQKAFSEASRVLKNGGIFLLSVRSTSRYLEKNRQDIGDESGLGGHTYIPHEGSKAGIILHQYSKQEIRKLAEDNDLEIIKNKDGEEEIKEVIRYKGEPSRQRGNWLVAFRKKMKK